MTSKHIVHLSKGRIPDSVADWQQEDLSFSALMAITNDAPAALKLFAEQYERQRGAHVDLLRRTYDGTRPRTAAELARAEKRTRKPPPSDRVVKSVEVSQRRQMSVLAWRRPGSEDRIDRQAVGASHPRTSLHSAAFVSVIAQLPSGQ